MRGTSQGSGRLGSFHVKTLHVQSDLLLDIFGGVCKYFVHCLSESRVIADDTDFADF